jgi:arylsulfatase A-like enzyme
MLAVGHDAPPRNGRRQPPGLPPPSQEVQAPKGAPTILEAAGVQMPAVLNGVPQKPIEGVSMIYSFDDAKAPSTHRTQYFEMFANRAISSDGWVAATTSADALTSADR